MMDYKKMMGYGKKKEKVVKKLTKSKPKVNQVLESVKEEFGYKNDLKEVGAAVEYRKYSKKIDKSRDLFGREVLKFYELLRKKGLDDVAGDLLDNYKNNVIKFGKEFKELIRRMI